MELKCSLGVRTQYALNRTAYGIEIQFQYRCYRLRQTLLIAPLMELKFCF